MLAVEGRVVAGATYVGVVPLKERHIGAIDAYVI